MDAKNFTLRTNAQFSRPLSGAVYILRMTLVCIELRVPALRLCAHVKDQILSDCQ